jgi:Zn finger protein HypA/HybF involved in hydrogenase expression
VHEHGPIAGAVAALLAAAGTRPVATVTVTLGPGMDPEVASAAWAQASAGTAAGGAAVTWAEALDTLRCLDCGRDYPGDRLARCPACGGDGLVVDAAPQVAITAWNGGHGSRG